MNSPNLRHSPFSFTKPPAGSRVDTAHPLSRGLVEMFPLSERGGLSSNGIVNGSRGTLVSSPTWTTAPMGGAALRFTAGLNNYLNIPYPFLGAVGPTSNLSITSWVSLPSPTASQRPLYVIANTNEFEIGFGTTTGVKWTAEVGKAGVGTQLTSALANATGSVYYMLTLALRGTDAKIDFFVNGALQGTTALNATTLGATAASRGWTVGTEISNAASFRPSTSDVYAVYFHNRALNASEAMRLYNEPFCMLRGPR